MCGDPTAFERLAQIQSVEEALLSREKRRRPLLATVESGCDRVGMLETVEGERKVIQAESRGCWWSNARRRAQVFVIINLK